MNTYQVIAELTAKGTPMVVISVTEKFGDGPAEVGRKLILTNRDEAYGTVGGGALEYEARELAKTVFQTRKSFTKSYLLDEGKIVPNAETLPMACGGKVTLFFEYVGPQEFIYVFGAGHVGQALTNVLKTMNFHVTVIDERPDVIAQFKGGDVVVCAPFSEYVRIQGLQPDSMVVVCTPSHKHDYNVLHAIIESNVDLKYVGMLCSLKKLREYVDKTKEQFDTDINLKQFYAPVGLDLGGGSPAEIAISIAAEILVVSNGKETLRHMRERNHDPYRYWED